MRDSSEALYITGVFEGSVGFDPGETVFELVSSNKIDIFICKLSSEGEFI